nr:MAG TPA: cytochrome b6 [Caudoviricetes sp.]
MSGFSLCWFLTLAGILGFCLLFHCFLSANHVP